MWVELAPVANIAQDASHLLDDLHVLERRFQRVCGGLHRFHRAVPGRFAGETCLFSGMSSLLTGRPCCFTGLAKLFPFLPQRLKGFPMLVANLARLFRHFAELFGLAPRSLGGTALIFGGSPILLSGFPTLLGLLPDAFCLLATLFGLEVVVCHVHKRIRRESARSRLGCQAVTVRCSSDLALDPYGPV
jgi:hypothetical protein